MMSLKAELIEVRRQRDDLAQQRALKAPPVPAPAAPGEAFEYVDPVVITKPAPGLSFKEKLVALLTHKFGGSG